MDQSTCCDLDTAKCGGAAVTCPTGKYLDPSKAGTAGTTSDACCTAQATCAAFSAASTSCGPGMKVKATLTDLTCTTSATNSASTCAACCEADTTICDGASVTCPTGKFKDASKAAA